MVRVCDVNNFYSPNGAGVRSYHDARLELFAGREGYRYALVVPSDRNRRTRHGNATVYEVPALPIPRRVYRCIVSWRVLRAVFEDFRPDIVEAGSPYLLPSLVRRAAAGTDITLTAFYHADFPDAYFGHAAATISERLRPSAVRIGRWLVRQAYRDCAVVACASGHAERRLRQAGVAATARTPLGFDPSVFRPPDRRGATRRALGIGEETALVLHVARLHPEKSVRQIMAAWDRVDRRDDRTLAIVLHGPLATSFERRYAARRDVRLLEYRPDRRELAALLGDADLMLSLSPYDTFSLATVEAMGCGTPVLAVRESAAAELVSACAGGALVADTTPEAIADGIEAALLRPSSSAERRDLHRRVADRYSLERGFERQLAVYEATIQGASSASKRAAVPARPQRVG